MSDKILDSTIVLAFLRCCIQEAIAAGHNEDDAEDIGFERLQATYPNFREIIDRDSSVVRAGRKLVPVGFRDRCGRHGSFCDRNELVTPWMARQFLIDRGIDPDAKEERVNPSRRRRRFSDKQVKEIYTMRFKKGIIVRFIAAHFKVSVGSINSIIKGRTYKDLWQRYSPAKGAIAL